MLPADAVAAFAVACAVADMQLTTQEEPYWTLLLPLGDTVTIHGKQDTLCSAC